MKVTLRDVIPEDAVRHEVEALVSRLLDRTVSFDMRYEGAPHKKQEPPEVPIVCDICGRDDFVSPQALGGHRFHKHGIRISA